MGGETLLLKWQMEHTNRSKFDFVKREARSQRVPYQRMIRALVDAYAKREKA